MSDSFPQAMTSADAQYERRSPFADAGRLVAHTLLVYVCALHFSPWLVGRWFLLIAPALQISSGGHPGDWYLQHLELVTIVPALVVGYFNIFRFAPTWLGGPKEGNQSGNSALWSCALPSLILCYELLAYRTPASVLYDRSVYESCMLALKYFFVIEPEMPGLSNLFASDPKRVLEQMNVTAPFYAGIAYTVGALAAKYDVLHKLFSLQSPEGPEPNSSTTDE
jgi:hypothetical protein